MPKVGRAISKPGYLFLSTAGVISCNNDCSIERGLSVRVVRWGENDVSCSCEAVWDMSVHRKGQSSIVQHHICFH